MLGIVPHHNLRTRLKEANKKAPISRDKEIIQLQENHSSMINQLSNKELNASELRFTK